MFHGKFFISFKPYLQRDEVDRLLPVLKDDFAVVVLATAYGIPERHIDKSMLEDINLFDHARIRMYQGAGGKARAAPPFPGASGGGAPAPQKTPAASSGAGAKGAAAAQLNEKSR